MSYLLDLTKMQEFSTIEKELAILKTKLDFVDKLSRSTYGGRETKYLVLNYEQIKLRIDASKNHSRPHIHLDYGKNFHAASIAIDSGEILIGTIPGKYSKTILEWVNKNREILNKIWVALREGQNPDKHKLELST